MVVCGNWGVTQVCYSLPTKSSDADITLEKPRPRPRPAYKGSQTASTEVPAPTIDPADQNHFGNPLMPPSRLREDLTSHHPGYHDGHIGASRPHPNTLPNSEHSIEEGRSYSDPSQFRMYADSKTFQPAPFSFVDTLDNRQDNMLRPPEPQQTMYHQQGTRGYAAGYFAGEPGPHSGA
jgi:hypothetical protein